MAMIQLDTITQVVLSSLSLSTITKRICVNDKLTLLHILQILRYASVIGINIYMKKTRYKRSISSLDHYVRFIHSSSKSNRMA